MLDAASSAQALREKSVLRPIGYRASPCGYCHGAHGSNTGGSYFMQSSQLNLDDYQHLLDRGWRRSGPILYKPDIRHSCCPHYTIRLPANQFKAAKDQRQALNRWNSHVQGPEYLKEKTRRHPQTKEEKALARGEFNLCRAVHASEHDELEPGIPPAHKLQVDLEYDTFTTEKLDLYRNYQVNVHREDPASITRSSFSHFLCHSPLRKASVAQDDDTKLLGSFHQLYRVNGRLIAMAVLDLLPRCVSSVYLMYHSDYAQWNFGKLSALREIAITLENDYDYYYMGYYIHPCAKMRYKADYRPQYVLDPETHQWDLFDEAMQGFFDMQQHHSLSAQRSCPLSHAVPDDESTIERHPEIVRTRYSYQSAAEVESALADGLPLLKVAMPGLPTAAELATKVNYADMLIRLHGTYLAHLLDVVRASLPVGVRYFAPPAFIADLAAAVGPDLFAAVITDIPANRTVYEENHAAFVERFTVV